MAIFRFFDNYRKLIAEYEDNFPYIFPRVGEHIFLKKNQKDTKVSWIHHKLPNSTPNSRYIIEVGLE